MIKQGDVVQVGNVIGTVMKVHEIKSIGFVLTHFKKKRTYDVGLYDVPEDQLTFIRNAD